MKKILFVIVSFVNILFVSCCNDNSHNLHTYSVLIDGNCEKILYDNGVQKNNHKLINDFCLYHFKNNWTEIVKHEYPTEMYYIVPADEKYIDELNKNLDDIIEHPGHWGNKFHVFYIKKLQSSYKCVGLS